MAYAVKEVFLTIQGEGAQSGRVAVFLRFAGCNLWSGREADRGKAVCSFCDTLFVGTDGEGGGKFHSPDILAEHVRQVWDEGVTSPEDGKRKRLVVMTGGEPMLQVTKELVDCLHRQGLEVAMESNGTIPIPEDIDIDWVCISPKADTEIKQRKGDELKLVYPQAENHPSEFQNSDYQFKYYFLSPKDEGGWRENALKVAEYCIKNPVWRYSLQTHKIIGLP